MTARFRMRPRHWMGLVLAAPAAWFGLSNLQGLATPRIADAESLAAGEALFRHEWRPHDPLTSGDGIGPVFNAKSCLECHNQGGAGGGGANDKNVTVYGLVADAPGVPGVPAPLKVPAVGVVHFRAVSPEFQETLSMVHSALPTKPRVPLSSLISASRRSMPAGVSITQRNTPALFGDGLIDRVPDAAIVTQARVHSEAARLIGMDRATDPKIKGRVARLADGRIGKFGWKGEFATLGDFVRAACANELGLSNPSRPQATPLGKPGYAATGVDLTDAQCELMTDYLKALETPKPVEPVDSAARVEAAHGRVLFTKIGCADCHTPSLGPINAFYSDLLLHDMGPDLGSSTGYYGPPPGGTGDEPAKAGEWRTAPLWGVADSAPYLHDGRAETLHDAVMLHGAEAVDVNGRYQALSTEDQKALIGFLKTLRAPARPDEASVSR